MSLRLKKMFDRMKQEKRPAFISYLTGGDPCYSESIRIIDTLADAGIDMLELGIPFSDPLADGETNQLSAQRALESGIKPSDVLEIASAVRKKHPELPIVLYTYLNPVAFAVDFKTFCLNAVSSGVDAMLLLDLTPEEGSGYYRRIVDEAGLSLVGLVAPNTPDDRIGVIAGFATGFIYYVSREGVTGARTDFAADAAGKIANIRRHTDLPVVMGFGISTPEQVKLARDTGADGIVVGSAIVRKVAEYASGRCGIDDIGLLVRGMVDGLVIR